MTGHLGPGSRTPTSALDLPALDHAVRGFIATHDQRPHREIGSCPRVA